MKPKIKDGVSVLYRKKRTKGKFELCFLVNLTDSAFSFAVNKKCLEIIKMFDGKHTIENIVGSAKVPQSDVEQIISQLDSNGLVETNCALLQSTSSQLNFWAGFENSAVTRQELQARIERANVGIIGLGGIGSWVFQGLHLLGVKNFIVADPDKVEFSNLNRQCLYNQEDLGERKLNVLERNLKTKGSKDTRLIKVLRKVKSVKDCRRIFSKVDLLINCADEPSTDTVNRVVTKAAYPLGIPHILCGGYDGHLGFVGPTLIPGHSPCWYCCEKSIEHHLRKSGYTHLLITEAHAKGGSIAPICAVVANYHVMEAMKVITGIQNLALDKQMIEIDFLTFRISPKQMHKQKGCRICGNYNKLQ